VYMEVAVAFGNQNVTNSYHIWRRISHAAFGILGIPKSFMSYCEPVGSTLRTWKLKRSV
jgi:hypothetical protein